MISRFSRLSVLACTAALAAGMLVSAPASQAASLGIKVVTSSAAPSIAYDRPGDPSPGATAVFVLCQSTTVRCRGTIQWQKTDGTPIGVKAGYVLNKNTYAYFYPRVDPALVQATGFGTSEKNAQVALTQSSPAKPASVTKVHLEPRIRSRELKGDISPRPSNVTDVKIHRWIPHGNRLVAAGLLKIAPGENSYNMGHVTVGTNNSAAADYRMSISARVDGAYREWFWRGAPDGTTLTGGGTMLSAGPVRVTGDEDPYLANFSFGTVTGTVNQGTTDTTSVKVTVAGAPAVHPASITSRKALDVPYCADSYGSRRIDVGDAYSIPFVPRGSDKRYAIGVMPIDGDATELWNDEGPGGTQDFGSCLHLRGYGTSTANLIPLNVDSLDRTVTLRKTGGSVSGVIKFPGYTQNIRDVALDVRQYIPGVPVLSSPIVVDGNVQPGGGYLFDNLAPGAYYLSVGRKQNCQNWLASKYNNNTSHINSASDRETEQWKSFGRLSSLSGSWNNGNPTGYEAIAIAHGATYAQQDRIPGGYAGWMFRDHCRYEGAGGYMRFDVTTGATGSKPEATASFSNSRGATISGKVRRSGGRTYKEMMVSAYSTQGLLVGRTAISGSDGSFTIRGLQSGNYRIVLNTDSWRGLGRTHTGTQYKSVTRGKSYGVGTLTAYF